MVIKLDVRKHLAVQLVS